MTRLRLGRLFAPSVLVAAVSAVALAASPASAVTINRINIGTSAIPQGANCVYLTAVPDLGRQRTSAAHTFRAGTNFSVSDFAVNTGETVQFEWHRDNCGPSSFIRTTSYTAPNTTPWNIN